MSKQSKKRKVDEYENQKGSHKSPHRRSQGRKSQFRGNRYTTEKSTEATSASADKLRAGDEEIIYDETHSYKIIDFHSVFDEISNLVVCSSCHNKVKFKVATSAGLGFKIAVECEECGNAYINSGPKIRQAYEVNRRIVFVMRLLGHGRSGINLFCGLMDLAPEFYAETFNGCTKNVTEAIKTVYDCSINNAIKEEKEKTLALEKSEKDLTASGDATWKKRGHTSRIGVTTLAGKYSKKIIDTVVKSSYCPLCTQWENKKDKDPEGYQEFLLLHDENECTANHKGSSGQMEAASIKEMFGRSWSKFGVRYTRYIGDGDSSTFKCLIDLNPYDIPVKKIECYLHVKKRMGSRCRSLKKTNKNLGGRGKGTLKLTANVINDLQKYYGHAISKNQSNVDQMYKDIWATLYHKASSDDKPQHQNCSVDWCGYLKAQAQGCDMSKYKHKYKPLDPAVVTALKPIYEDLSRTDLLERCLGGNTQNNNESFNGLLWSFTPKHLYGGFDSVQQATYIATCIFNDGFKAILQAFKVLGLKIGKNATIFVEKRDDNRIKLANKRHLTESKEARAALRAAASSLETMYEEQEGQSYGPGMAD